MRNKKVSFVNRIAEDLEATRRKLLEWDKASTCRHRAGCNYHGQCCDLIEQANSIILLMDPEGVLFFVNDYAERFFGYGHGELLGRNIVGSLVPDHESTGRDLGMLIRDIARHPDQYLSSINENMRRSGERVWVSWTNRAITDRHGKITEIICIGNDITSRKHMEDALRKSEQRYRCLFESSLDPIILLGRDGRVWDVNMAALNTFGYSREEALGFFIGELFESADEYRAIREQLRTYAVAHDYELRLRKRDGTVLNCLVSVTIHHHCDGKDRCLQVFAHDITVQRHMENALRESERRLSIVLDAIPDIVYRIDTDGKISFVSASIRKYGYDPGDLIGKSVFDIVHPDDQLLARQCMHDRQLGQKRSCPIQLRLLAKSHESVHFEINSENVEMAPVFLVEAAGIYRGDHVHKDNFLGSQGVARDISERKAAERALRESEARFRTLFEMEAHAVILIDRELGRIVDVNSAGTDLYGYTRDEFLRLIPSDLWAEDEGGHSAETDAGDDPSFRKHRKKDGSIFPVQTSGGTIEIFGHQLFLYTVRDVTDHIRAEEETILREKLEGVLEMAHAVCHEINQPLQVLAGYTEILLQGKVDTNDTGRYFTEIMGAVGRMRDITRKLNNITRYETRPYANDRKIIDIERASGD